MQTGVGDAEWLYKCEFKNLPSSEAFKHGLLVFEGLDTICDVYLVSIYSYVMIKC